jgi:transcription elongation GreA/GreB family factor
VSKAFTKEDGGGGEELENLPKLEPWPADVKNYLTPDGYQDLKQWIEFLRSPESKTYRTRAFREAKLAAMLSRLAAAEEVKPPEAWTEDDPVRFGMTVTVTDEESGHTRDYTIVGVDEADGYDRISWRSPVARALLGKKGGDYVTVRLPGNKKQDLNIMTVKYEKPKKKR